MAGFRIAPHVGRASPIPKAKPTKNKSYLAWIHCLPCIITGQYGVEAAHLSMSAPRYGHYGRARGHKAPDRWILPLCKAEHDRSHAIGEDLFWRNAGIDPHILALTIHGLWTDLGDDAEPFATAIINQARLQQ